MISKLLAYFGYYKKEEKVENPFLDLKPHTYPEEPKFDFRKYIPPEPTVEKVSVSVTIGHKMGGCCWPWISGDGSMIRVGKPQGKCPHLRIDGPILTEGPNYEYKISKTHTDYVCTLFNAVLTPGGILDIPQRCSKCLEATGDKND